MQDVIFYVKKYGKDIVLFCLILTLLGFVIYGTFFKQDSNDDNKPTELVYAEAETNKDNINDNATNSKENTVFVDIKGAVKKPGVYEIGTNAIVNDVIKLAGGFNSSAYQDGINLSKKVKNEMVIYVYTKTEIKKFQEENNKVNLLENDTCKVPDYTICECVEDKKSIIEIGDSDKSNSEEVPSKKLVNINTALNEELTTLTGIGESKAVAIIKYREENGKFAKIEDIMNVSGIGEKAFEKIKDFITV